MTAYFEENYLDFRSPLPRNSMTNSSPITAAAIMASKRISCREIPKS